MMLPTMWADVEAVNEKAAIARATAQDEWDMEETGKEIYEVKELRGDDTDE